MSSVTLFLEKLKAHTIIGVNPQERVNKQPVIIDVVFDLDRSAQCGNDNDTLASTIDYQKLAEELVAFIESTQYHLLEMLAEAAADAMLNQFTAIKRLRLTLTKPQALPQTPGVGVIVERFSS